MKKLIVIALMAAVSAVFVHIPQRARADAVCYVNAGATPVPAGIQGFSFPLCDASGHLMTTGSGATPIAYPTNTAGVLLVQPTNVPTLTVTGTVTVNTPPPFSGVVTQGTSPWVVNTPPPAPTPIAFPTSAGGFLLVAPTAIPTISVACTNCPTPLAVQPISGTVTVNTPAPFSGVVTQGTSPWVVNTPVPFPTAVGGTLRVDGSAVTQPVSGTFFQATQPVSGTFFQATQPVSGTVTANAGTGYPTPLAVQPVSGTVTANAGTGFPTPVPYATSASTVLKVDGSGVTQPVSGTLTVNTPPPTTTVTVTQATGTNLHAVLDTTSTTAVTQATGSNLHAVLDAGAAVIGHVINDAGAALIGKVGIDQTTAGTTNLTNSKICDTTTSTTCASVDTSGRLSVTNKLTNGTILTSASATACTNILAAASRGIEITNSGPATTIFPQFYSDVGATCAAGTLLFGDGTTITIGAGQVIRIDYPMAGIAYKLSGALSSNMAVTGL
jgi:hypothetical protein